MVLSFFKRKKKEEPKPKAQPSQPNQSNNYKEIIEESPITGLVYHYNYNEKDKSIDLLSPGILDAWVENPGQIKEDYLKELFEEATYGIPNPHKEITSLKKINISSNVLPADVDLFRGKSKEVFDTYLFERFINFGGTKGSYWALAVVTKDRVEKNEEVPSDFLLGNVYLLGSFSGFFLSDNLLLSSPLNMSENPVKYQHNDVRPVLVILDNSEYTAYQAGHLLKDGIKNHYRLKDPLRKILLLYYSDLILISPYGFNTVLSGSLFSMSKDEIREALGDVLLGKIDKEYEEKMASVIKRHRVKAHKIKINEERLIYATYNLGFTTFQENETKSKNNSSNLLSELHKNLNQKGYELYQDVIVIIKKGALRPIYYSLVYPVKKETAEEVGSKVTLYRVKTDKDTGKVINLEPIEEHKVKGTIDDLMDLRSEEIIHIYESLAAKYGKDPIREEDIPIMISGDWYDLLISPAEEYMRKSAEVYLTDEYIDLLLEKIGEIAGSQEMSSEEKEEFKDRIFFALESKYKGVEEFLERDASEREYKNYLGGFFIAKRSKDGEMAVAYF